MDPCCIRRRSNSQALAAAKNIQEILEILYSQRGLNNSEVAVPELKELESINSLRGIDTAVELLATHIQANSQILIIGDYDADGATGSALAVRGLRALGAGRVSYLVPSRFAFGYGLSTAVVELAYDRYHPDLLLTVDQGTGDQVGVTRARELGIPVIITDHHLPSGKVPDAAAVINPNQPGCQFASKCLTGVGVVLYLLLALRAYLRECKWFVAPRGDPNLGELLDLVALGTIADVANLDRNNRILVEQGLRRLRAGQGNPGIRALFQVAGRDVKRATTTDLAFFIAPRLNAAGRLEDMSLGVECLLADDPLQAVQLAHTLDDLNQRRRAIEIEMQEEAETWLQNLQIDLDDLPAGLCLFGANWHEGVIGILAARIKERYHRPVIAFAQGGDGYLRGSARSIEGFHIRDSIAQISHAYPGLIQRFGGHAMAAGLTLDSNALPTFRNAFADLVCAQLGELPIQRELISDGQLPAYLFNLKLVETLQFAAPWGKGFPSPSFDGVFVVRDKRLLKERHLKLKVALANGVLVDAIGFNLGECFTEIKNSVELVYRLDINEFRGVRTPQFIVEYCAPVKNNSINQ